MVIQSQFLKNEISSCKVAINAEFIIQREEHDGVVTSIPRIKAHGSYAKDSQSIEKVVKMPNGHACKSFTDKTISVKVSTNTFSSFVSTMSKFSTDVNLLIGKSKSTNDGVIVFEMNCDNEENNIFSVRRCDV